MNEVTEINILRTPKLACNLLKEKKWPFLPLFEIPEGIFFGHRTLNIYSDDPELYIKDNIVTDICLKTGLL